jgi:hypothetical protein
LIPGAAGKILQVARVLPAESRSSDDARVITTYTWWHTVLLLSSFKEVIDGI